MFAFLLSQISFCFTLGLVIFQTIDEKNAKLVVCICQRLKALQEQCQLFGEE